MQVQVNTGNGFENTETLERWANEFLNQQLARFSQEITRIEVQLSDENNAKGGAADKRCMMEARLEGVPPMAVSHDAATVEAAIDGAASRLERAIEHTLGRLRSA